MSDDIVKRLRGWPAVIKANGLMCEAADHIEELEAQLEKVKAAAIDTGVHLAAAVSLLKSGGRQASGSDKMFAQMIMDYEASIDRLRATIAELDASK